MRAMILLAPLAALGLGGCVAYGVHGEPYGYGYGYGSAYGYHGYGYSEPSISIFSHPRYIYNVPPSHRHGTRGDRRGEHRAGPGEHRARPGEHRAQRPEGSRGRRDRDGDGVPDRFNRDRDGDGVPDGRRPGRRRPD